MNLKIGQLRLQSLRNRKKRRMKKKGTEPQRLVTHHQMHQYTHSGVPEAEVIKGKKEYLKK